jgi:hypothetical protein
MVNKPVSACHSIIFKIKEEFVIILTHQEIGIKQIIKSPHLP